jgi:hypothetical protein
MRTIDLGSASPSLPELLQLASEDNVILRTAGGQEFVLAEVDDLSQEVALIRNQPELMALLAERSHAAETYSLDQVRSKLGLN